MNQEDGFGADARLSERTKVKIRSNLVVPGWRNVLAQAVQWGRRGRVPHDEM